jgi:hypothetical protein
MCIARKRLQVLILFPQEVPVMAEYAKKNWEELARAARDEQDSEKLIVIVEELNRALDEQVRPRGESQRKTTGEESNVLQLV